MEAFRSAVEQINEVAARFDIVDRILELGPLHRAVALEDSATVKWLLDWGEDPDDDDGTSYGFTTAHWAAMRCGVHILELLYDHGANMSAADYNGLTPLHVAAMSGNVPALSWLLRHTRDLEAREEFNQTPLHQAALNGKLEAAEMLVSAGASLEAADVFDLTPICLAVVRGFPNLVAYLLKRGANVGVRDRSLKSLLHIAAATDQTVVIGWLVSGGLDVDARDRWNCTPLHDAAKKGCCDAIGLLLDRGADSCAKDAKGCTPACKAKNAGEMKALKILLERIEEENAARKSSSMKKRGKNGTGADNDIRSVIKKKKLIKKNQRRKAPQTRKPLVGSWEVKVSSYAGVKHFTYTGRLDGISVEPDFTCPHLKSNFVFKEEDSSSEDEDKSWGSIVDVVKDVVSTDSENEDLAPGWEEEMDSKLAKLTYHEILRVIF